MLIKHESQASLAVVGSNQRKPLVGKRIRQSAAQDIIIFDNGDCFILSSHFFISHRVYFNLLISFTTYLPILFSVSRILLKWLATSILARSDNPLSELLTQSSASLISASSRLLSFFKSRPAISR